MGWPGGQPQGHCGRSSAAEQRSRERLSESRKRAVQTLKRRREERGTRGDAGDKDLDDSDVGDM